MIQLSPAPERANPRVMRGFTCLAQLVFGPIAGIAFYFLGFALYLQVAAESGQGSGLVGIVLFISAIGVMWAVNRFITLPIIHRFADMWRNTVLRKVGAAQLSVSTDNPTVDEAFTVQVEQPVLDDITVQRVDVQLVRRRINRNMEGAGSGSLLVSNLAVSETTIIAESVPGKGYTAGETLTAEASLTIPTGTVMTPERPEVDLEFILRLRVRLHQWADYVQDYPLPLVQND